MTSIILLKTLPPETLGLECKLAAGRDGKGQLPADFWPTYSAFANSRGCIILLGEGTKTNLKRELLEEFNLHPSGDALWPFPGPAEASSPGCPCFS